MHTSELELKAIAKAVGASLSRTGHVVPHTAVLHAISAALDKRDWQTLKASLAPGQKAAEVLKSGSIAVVQAPSEELPEPKVSAEFWTDDRAVEVTFDARPYLIQASKQELVGIIEAGYSGDYSTDAIAEFCESLVPEISEGFAYIHTVQKSHSKLQDVGFECSINAVEYLHWMAAYREPLLASILCARHGVEVHESKNDNDNSRWSWKQDFPLNRACEHSYDSKRSANLGAYISLNLLGEELREHLNN